MRLFFIFCIALLCINIQGQSIKKFKIFVEDDNTMVKKFDSVEGYLINQDFYTYHENWVILTDTSYVNQYCDSTRIFLGLFGKYKERCFDLYISHEFKLINDNRRNSYIQMESYGHSKQIGKIGFDPVKTNNRRIIKEKSAILKNDIATYIKTIK